MNKNCKILNDCNKTTLDYAYKLTEWYTDDERANDEGKLIYEVKLYSLDL